MFQEAMAWFSSHVGETALSVVDVRATRIGPRGPFLSGHGLLQTPDKSGLCWKKSTSSQNCVPTSPPWERQTGSDRGAHSAAWASPLQVATPGPPQLAGHQPPPTLSAAGLSQVLSWPWSIPSISAWYPARKNLSKTICDSSFLCHFIGSLTEKL